MLCEVFEFYVYLILFKFIQVTNCGFDLPTASDSQVDSLLVHDLPDGLPLNELASKLRNLYRRASLSPTLG